MRFVGIATLTDGRSGYAQLILHLESAVRMQIFASAIISPDLVAFAVRTPLPRLEQWSPTCDDDYDSS